MNGHIQNYPLYKVHYSGIHLAEDSKVRPKSSAPEKTRKMVSILTKHLKENHEMWLNVLKEEEASRGSDNDSPTEEAVTSKPMAPIREDSEERTSDTHSMEDERQEGSTSSSPIKTKEPDRDNGDQDVKIPEKEQVKGEEGTMTKGANERLERKVQKVPSVVVEGETILEEGGMSDKPTEVAKGIR